MARMLNIFATPGDVFDEVKASKPSVANWLVPILLSILIGAISIVVVFSQPNVMQQMRDQQNKVFEDQIKAGKMTQADADRAEAMMGKVGPAIMEATAIVGIVIVMFVRLFWWALVLWLLGKWFLQADFPYQTALEVAGLASVISVLGSIVICLVSVTVGKMTVINLALLDPNGNPQGFLHMALADLELFDVWLAVLMSVGLARLAKVSWGKAATVTGVYWVIMQVLLVSVSWSASQLFSSLNHHH